MKLVRVGDKGQEKQGILAEDGSVRLLPGRFGRSADLLSPEGLKDVGSLEVAALPKAAPNLRFGACVADVGKMVCVGRNYTEHANEMGGEPPEEPILFSKATSAISGPNDPIVIPLKAEAVDYETELGVVIGLEAKNVTQERALDHVAGYCIVNDVSERVWQKKRAGQWTKGKSADTFGPIGPWLVTRDEIPDVQELALTCRVDGEIRQQSSTKFMIFSCAFLVSYISQFMSLQPGDIIATGTPAGVAAGMKPPAWLKPGQVVELSIEGLGVQRNEVLAS